MQQHALAGVRELRGAHLVIDDVPLDDVVVARRNLAHQALLKRWLDQVGRPLLGLSSASARLAARS